MQLLTSQPILKWCQWYPLVTCTCLNGRGVGPLSELSQGSAWVRKARIILSTLAGTLRN